MALRRDAAQEGDDIWISGWLGDARLALAAYRNETVLEAAALAQAAPRMHAPDPRVSLGLALRGIAHAAIDLSDGLRGDLGHILQRSGIGATVDVDALPRSVLLARQADMLQLQCVLAGGDDYELCFTAPASRREQVLAAGHACGVAVTRVGRIDAAPGLRLHRADGTALQADFASFDHFATP